MLGQARLRRPHCRLRLDPDLPRSLDSLRAKLTIGLRSLQHPSRPMKHLRIYTRHHRLRLVAGLIFQIDGGLGFPCAHRIV
jgi:hypothetical protein